MTYKIVDKITVDKLVNSKEPLITKSEVNLLSPFLQETELNKKVSKDTNYYTSIGVRIFKEIITMDSTYKNINKRANYNKEKTIEICREQFDEQKQKRVNNILNVLNTNFNWKKYQGLELFYELKNKLSDELEFIVDKHVINKALVEKSQVKIDKKLTKKLQKLPQEIESIGIETAFIYGSYLQFLKGLKDNPSDVDLTLIINPNFEMYKKIQESPIYFEGIEWGPNILFKGKEKGLIIYNDIEIGKEQKLIFNKNITKDTFEFYKPNLKFSKNKDLWSGATELLMQRQYLCKSNEKIENDKKEKPRKIMARYRAFEERKNKLDRTKELKLIKPKISRSMYSDELRANEIKNHIAKATIEFSSYLQKIKQHM